MCDFDDDFEDFEDDGFSDQDQAGDEALDDVDSLDDDFQDNLGESDDECDEFSGKDAFFIGGAMGWAYEEGLQDGSRQQRKKKPKKRQG